MMRAKHSKEGPDKDVEELLAKYKGRELRYLCELTRAYNKPICTTRWSTSSPCECQAVTLTTPTH